MRSTGERLNRDISTPKPDGTAPESLPRSSAHDGWMRALGYLLLGAIIPRFALLFDKLAWRDPDKGGYAFVDSFSLTPPYGHDENLGIDVGPLLLAIAAEVPVGSRNQPADRLLLAPLDPVLCNTST